MAKPEARKVKFCNVSVPSILFAVVTADLPKHEADIVLAFIELASEGVKVSFSYQEDKHSYTVGVTLPKPTGDYDLQTASFWDKELYDALCAAYIATFLYKADKYGWEIAQEAMKNAEKSIAAQVRSLDMGLLK